MKKAFTMIELIFVIVIIGILAAVAIPKLTGIFSQAKGSKVVAYAGTLQRTTIPPYWSESIMAGDRGELNSTNYANKILADLDYPTDFEVVNGGSGAPDFANKLAPVTFDFNATSSPTAAITLAKTGSLSGKIYSLVCTNGDKLTAPKCDIYDGTKWILTNNR